MMQEERRRQKSGRWDFVLGCVQLEFVDVKLKYIT